MAKTIVGELKDLYVKFGGNAADVADKLTTSELLDAIEQVYNGNNDFVVTYRDTGEEGTETGEYILECDKTAQEIQEAYVNGKTIIAQFEDVLEVGYDRHLLTLCRVQEDETTIGFEFYGIKLPSMTITSVFHYSSHGEEGSFYTEAIISTT